MNILLESLMAYRILGNFTAFWVIAAIWAPEELFDGMYRNAFENTLFFLGAIMLFVVGNFPQWSFQKLAAGYRKIRPRWDDETTLEGVVQISSKLPFHTYIGLFYALVLTLASMQPRSAMDETVRPFTEHPLQILCGILILVLIIIMAWQAVLAVYRILQWFVSGKANLQIFSRSPQAEEALLRGFVLLQTTRIPDRGFDIRIRCVGRENTILWEDSLTGIRGTTVTIRGTRMTRADWAFCLRGDMRIQNVLCKPVNERATWQLEIRGAFPVISLRHDFEFFTEPPPKEWTSDVA